MKEWTLEDLKDALRSLGECKVHGKQLRINCPKCENELSYAKDKFNLEICFKGDKRGIYHCWSCHSHGTVHKLISLYGNKHYLDLFKSKHTTIEEPSEEIQQFLDFPSHCISVLSLPKVLEYLTSRGLTQQIIKEREIVYCTKDYYKDCIIFPSYSSRNQLVSFVAHNFITKKYTVRKLHSEFVCFYEKFIDKRVKIIVTEGTFDSLVSPNSIPLLGTAISDNLLTFLTGCKVILAVDSDVDDLVKARLVKSLKKVCDEVEVFKYPKTYEDINDFFQKDKERLVKSLRSCYI